MHPARLAPRLDNHRPTAQERRPSPRGLDSAPLEPEDRISLSSVQGAPPARSRSLRPDEDPVDTFSPTYDLKSPVSDKSSSTHTSFESHQSQEQNRKQFSPSPITPQPSWSEKKKPSETVAIPSSPGGNLLYTGMSLMTRDSNPTLSNTFATLSWLS